MIEQRKTIKFYYNFEKKARVIDLFPDERYIKDCGDIIFCTTIIEILIPDDDIYKNCFLIPSNII
jgi:hypothetical protein